MNGFLYKANVIDVKSETQLLKWLESSELWSGVSTSKNARKVIHFGEAYKYRTNADTIAHPIPSELEPLLDIIQHREHLSCIVNRYLPGQGIAPHIDDTKQFGPTIWCFTIGSGTQILFKRPGSVIPMYVRPRSLYVMTGECRFQWSHSISSRKSDFIDGRKVRRGVRYSLTFRTRNIVN